MIYKQKTSPQTSERLIMAYYNIVPLSVPVPVPVHPLTDEEEEDYTAFINKIENALMCSELEDLGKKDEKQMETVEKLAEIDNEMQLLLTKIEQLTRSDDGEKDETDYYGEFLASLKKSSKDLPHYFPQPIQMPQEKSDHFSPQFQQMPPETSGNVPLGDLRKIGYVLFCFGNTEDLGEILKVLDKFFPTPHFTTGEIGVYRSLQNANILYLVIPPGRNDLTQQLINTSISLKGQTRENGEKWPLIARLHNPDLTQMTIPLN